MFNVRGLVSNCTRLLYGGAILLAASSALAVDTRPASLPASTQPTLIDAALRRMAEDLGDNDPAVREQASDRLLAAGSAALPVLGRAARSDVPEIRTRARQLLARVGWDVPGDPLSIRQLVKGFGALDPEKRGAVVRRLASSTGDDRLPAWHALGRILLYDPSDAVQWEVVSELRQHNPDDTALGIGPQDTASMSGPLCALVGRVYQRRQPQWAIQLFLRALAADRDADNPVRDRTEILFVLKDLLALAHSTRHEQEAAVLLREQYPLAAPIQRPWLNRELYALHATGGPLPGIEQDAEQRPPDLSDTPTLYALAVMQRKIGRRRFAAGIEWVAFQMPRWTWPLYLKAPGPFEAAKRLDVADFLVDLHWLELGERELNQVLRCAPADDAPGRIRVYFFLHRIAEARGNLPAQARNIRLALELMEKYPAARLSPLSSHMMPDDKDSVRAVLHWLNLRIAIRTGDGAAAEEEAAVLGKMRPINDALVLEAYPILKRTGRDAEARALFEANYVYLVKLLSENREPSALNRLAWMCVRCGLHLPEAESVAARAVADEPNNVAFIDTLAEAKFRLGKAGEAVLLETRALQLQPNNQTIKRNLDRYRGHAPAMTVPAEP